MEKQVPADIHNLDRGNFFGFGKGDGVITRGELLEALKQNGVSRELRLEAKHDKEVSNHMTLEQANKIFERVFKKSEFEKFGARSELPQTSQAIDPRLTALGEYAKILPFQPAKGETDGAYINRLQAALNQADTGIGTGLFNLNGRHDGYLQASEVVAMLEKQRGHSLNEDDRKEIEKLAPINGNGIQIHALVDCVIQDLAETHAPAKPTAVAANSSTNTKSERS